MSFQEVGSLKRHIDRCHGALLAGGKCWARRRRFESEVDKALKIEDGLGGDDEGVYLGGIDDVDDDNDGGGKGGGGDGDGDVNMGGTPIQEASRGMKGRGARQKTPVQSGEERESSDVAAKLSTRGRKRKSGGSNASEGEWASGRQMKKGVIVSGIGDMGIPVGPLFPQGRNALGSLGENDEKTQIDIDAEIAQALEVEGDHTNLPYLTHESDELHPEDDRSQHHGREQQAKTEVRPDADSPLDERTCQLLAGLEQHDVDSDDVISYLDDSDAEEENFDDGDNDEDDNEQESADFDSSDDDDNDNKDSGDVGTTHDADEPSKWKDEQISPHA